MKINLLSKPGTYGEKDLQDIEVDDSLISDISHNFKKDFESSHTVKKAKVRNSKKIMISYCFAVIILILCSIYYQLSFNSKSSLKSENLMSLIEYTIDSGELYLSNMIYNDYSLSINLVYNSDSVHKDEKLKTLINSLSDKSSFNLNLSFDGKNQLLTLQFPPFIEIKGNNFDDNTNVNYSSINTVSIDSLYLQLMNILNKKKIENFHLYQDQKIGYYKLAILTK
tara:strand:- start:1565 stop:2239 length:675 start_codon:yes stop_codon:yes gene_type:complete